MTAQPYEPYYCTSCVKLKAQLEQAERELRDCREKQLSWQQQCLKAERERDEAREDVARCAADTTAVELAQQVEFLKAELRNQRGYKLDPLARLARADTLAEALREIADTQHRDTEVCPACRADVALAAYEQEQKP